MNEHEAARITAAMHQLRPDWPAKQLATLLADPRIADRPRRDVTVALGWVACEVNTSSPYRVLEAGPWWRAAAIDGGNPNPREPFDPTGFCGICSQPQDRCQRNPHAEHGFIRADEFRAGNGVPRPAELTTTIPVRGAEQHTTQEDK